LVSGGKDSFYAVMKVGYIDIGVMLVYEFPRPSPHLINIGKSIESLLNANIPVVVKSVRKGVEKIETIDMLRRLSATEVVAGDVYIDEHLKYMEEVAKEVGATLIEPLWGEDPEDLVYKEIEDGVEPLLIGTSNNISNWIGVELNIDNINSFIDQCKKSGIDPLGEKGEYHTLVVNSPMHIKKTRYRKIDIVEYDDYRILIVI